MGFKKPFKAVPIKLGARYRHKRRTTIIRTLVIALVIGAVVGTVSALAFP